ILANIHSRSEDSLKNPKIDRFFRSYRLSNKIRLCIPSKLGCFCFDMRLLRTGSTFFTNIKLPILTEDPKCSSIFYSYIGIISETSAFGKLKNYSHY
ncbi:hypothetical protein ALC53_02136, partial [Atta colombica]